jgi:putative endonuclease
MPAHLYVLRLKSGQLYIGSTTNLKQRYKDHCSGEACRTTEIDRPFGLVHSETDESFSEAPRREAQLKRWTRAKKEAAIVGDAEKLHSLSQSRN